jgi:hypothetical protein
MYQRAADSRRGLERPRRCAGVTHGPRRFAVSQSPASAAPWSCPIRFACRLRGAEEKLPRRRLVSAPQVKAFCFACYSEAGNNICGVFLDVRTMRLGSCGSAHDYGSARWLSSFSRLRSRLRLHKPTSGVLLPAVTASGSTLDPTIAAARAVQSLRPWPVWGRITPASAQTMLQALAD